MREDLVQKTKKMFDHDIETITNPEHLISKLASKTIEEIKSIRTDKTGQLPPEEQRELSLRGDKTAFLEFHRFMYSLADDDVRRMMYSMKQFVFDEKLSKNGNEYLDQMIVNDAIHYHICLREKGYFDYAICGEIAASFRHNALRSRSFQEITSEHLINFAKYLLAKYFNIKKAREILNISQSALANELGVTPRQVSNLETGARPLQRQTQLAIECLLRREGKWTEFSQAECRWKGNDDDF